MNIVLVEPEIPPNTGNVARLCSATGTRLHLVGPLGFRLGDRELKRSGMDYWEQVDWQLWEDWGRFEAALSEEARCWFVEQGGRNDMIRLNLVLRIIWSLAGNQPGCRAHCLRGMPKHGFESQCLTARHVR